jgi:hydroxyacid-oxoacid transhydrogenase
MTANDDRPEAAESVFTWAAPPLKFGAGAVDEIGHDVAALGAARVLVLSDPGLAALGVPERVADSLRGAGVTAEVFDGVHVEPTDASMTAAVEHARATGPWDAFVAVGGGSSIDTAKAVSLLTSQPGELLDFVNAPIGGGRTPTGPLPPVVAVPTTAGTGAESTGTCVLDLLSLRVKSGISHALLRPVLAVVDPLLTMTLPAEVTAASGMDIVCHALESWTARPFSSSRRKAPEARVAYCGSNPVSDVWCERALTLVARSFRAAVHEGAHDVSARTDMALAATYAGLGFGNSGVHIPHASSYPVAGMVEGYQPAGYPSGHAMVPHGQAVSLTAPEAFRFTFDSAPERHLRAADLLGGGQVPDVEPVERLPQVLVALMGDIGVPDGLAAVGYGPQHVAALAAGAIKQQRLLDLSPRPVTEDDLAGILRGSLRNW